MTPLVSVIIPTRNSAKSIGECLEDILSQTYKNVEIMVIDNNSNDSTKEIAKRYTKLVFNKGPERSMQVNFGIRKSKGKYVYYTGSDLLERSKNLIEEAVEKSEKDNADAIYLNVLTNINNPNIWQKARALERKLYFKEPGVSAARFYKRDVFLKLGGFDESFGGISDDLEFQHRLDLGGYKTEFINSFENNANEYDSLKIIVTRALYYGWFISRYMKKHPKKTKEQYRFIRKEFRKKKILFQDKIAFLGFVLYKLVQYFFGGLGVILARISKNNNKIESFLFKLNYG